MSDTIELEIVRLIREISEDEEKLMQLESEAREADRATRIKNKYGSKIRSCKSSLERKMRLLNSLKA